MKKLLFIISVIICVSCRSQQPQVYPQYGGEWLRLLPKITQGLPYDTNAVYSGWKSIYPAVAAKGDSMYLWSVRQQKWIFIANGSGVSDRNILAQAGVIKYSAALEDTLRAGGILNRSVNYVVPHSFAGGQPQGAITYYNRQQPDSNIFNPYTSFNPNLGVYTGDADIYAPSMIRLYRTLDEKYKDTMNLQYGGMMTLTTRWTMDSANSVFGYIGQTGKKYKEMPTQGIAITNQFFPPRDSVDVFSGQDGQNGASFESFLGIGATWGYKFRVFSGIPNYPLTAYNSELDLMRDNSRLRKRQITGNGYTNYLASSKGWQQNISPATTEVGHYISKVYDFFSSGNSDWNIGVAGGATKAKVLLVSKIDSAFGFYSSPKWTVGNEIYNGYGFVAMGDSDYNYMQGRLRVGGTLPTRDNGGLGSKQFEVYGDSRFTMNKIFLKTSYTPTDAGYIGVAAYDLGALGPDNPAYINLLGSDSLTSVQFGSEYDKGGNVKAIGKRLNDGNAGGVDISANTDWLSTAGARIFFTDRSGAFVKRYGFHKQKFQMYATDSASFQAPAYKFGGMPRVTGSTWVLAYDSTTNYSSYVRLDALTAGAVPLSSISPSTKTNTIDNVNFAQRWKWDGTWATGKMFQITATPTGSLNCCAFATLFSVDLNGSDGSSTNPLINAAYIRNSRTADGGWNRGLEIDTRGNGSKNTGIYNTVTGAAGEDNVGVETIISGGGIDNYGFYSNVTGGGNNYAFYGVAGDVLNSSSSYYGWNNRSLIKSPGDGIITVTNNAGTDFTRLTLGPATSSFPALVRNSANLAVMLGDASAYTNIIASGFIAGTTNVSIANTNATTASLFGAATTGNIFGTPTGNVTHNYSGNATSTGNTKTVNIAINGAAGSTSNVNVGSANGGTTTINSPNFAIGTHFTWSATAGFLVEHTGGSRPITLNSGDDATFAQLRLGADGFGTGSLSNEGVTVDVGGETVTIGNKGGASVPRIKIKGGIHTDYTLEASDADVVISGSTSFVKISNWTTDRNISLPDSGEPETDGLEIRIWMNSSNNGISNRTITLPDGSTTTTIDRRTVTTLKAIDGEWVMINKGIY